MSSITPIRKPVPLHQADATLTQANPTSGTKYTILDTTKNVRIRGIAVQCTWTVQPDPLEVHVTIDGQVLTGTLNTPTSATWAYALERIALAGLYLIESGASYNFDRHLDLEGRSVKVEVEVTGGTVSELKARVKYAKW